jgi:histidinol phosphatase-like enzyme
VGKAKPDPDMIFHIIEQTPSVERVVMVGDKKSIGMAVHNNKIALRNTFLKERLQVKPEQEPSNLLWQL